MCNEIKHVVIQLHFIKGYSIFLNYQNRHVVQVSKIISIINFFFWMASAGRTRNDNSFSPMDYSVSRFLSLMGAFLFPQVKRHLVSSEKTKETKNLSTNLYLLFMQMQEFKKNLLSVYLKQLLKIFFSEICLK